MESCLFRIETHTTAEPTALAHPSNHTLTTTLPTFPTPLCVSEDQIAQILLSLKAQNSFYDAFLSPQARKLLRLDPKDYFTRCSFSQAEDIGRDSCCISPASAADRLGLVENMRYTKNSSKNMETQMIPNVAPHHIAPYHNHILSTVHHHHHNGTTTGGHHINPTHPHHHHHQNHHHVNGALVPPSPPSPKDKCNKGGLVGGGQVGSNNNGGVTNNNNGEEVQADRPIGYGAFGVVW